VTHSLGRAALAFVAVAVFTPSLAAQERDPLVRLAPSVRYAVEVLLDSARLAGLPTAPIESKALEGLSRRQDDRRILTAVRAVYRTLREARSVLGPTATADELSTSASALRAGLSTAELAKLVRVRQGKPITVPLVVMMDLMTRGVPRDTASATIFLLWQRGAVDDDLYGLWRGVERDIVSGTDPGMALLNRAREIPSRATPPVSPPPSSGRPEQSETQDR
jgi:hypothetical protein